MIERALSIRQPWAWLIVNGHKPIENRPWSTSFRGWFYIHAGKKFDGTLKTRQALRDMTWFKHSIVIPPDEELELGGIVGKAFLATVIERSNNPWFQGPYGFVLDGVRPLPFRPCAGKLSLFHVDE